MPPNMRKPKHGTCARPPSPWARSNEVKALAVRAYRALGCAGAARIDFRLNRHGRPVFFGNQYDPRDDPEELVADVRGPGRS